MVSGDGSHREAASCPGRAPADFLGQTGCMYLPPSLAQVGIPPGFGIGPDGSIPVGTVVVRDLLDEAEQLRCILLGEGNLDPEQEGEAPTILVDG